MGRSIEFDYPTALDKATRLFWQEGYSRASLRDLLKAMGIGEGSFYNTLKSKKRLYLECLKHYVATQGHKRGTALMSGPTASVGLRALFGVVLDCLDDPQTPSRLCMLAGTMSEEVLGEPDLREFVETGITNLSARISARLTADRQDGKLPAGLDPEITTAVILTYLQGIWRMALVSYDRPAFERQIDAFLTGLNL